MTDSINAIIFVIAGFIIYRSAFQIVKDRRVAGVHWSMPLFFGAWGAWNVPYFWHLGQVNSFGAGLFLLSAHVTYVVLFFRYRRKR